MEPVPKIDVGSGNAAETNDIPGTCQELWGSIGGLFNIAQRQRIAKIPPDRTGYEAGLGLPPFEDRGSGYHFAFFHVTSQQPRKLQHIQVERIAI